MRALVIAGVVATMPVLAAPAREPIALDTVVSLPQATHGRLRLDADGHPYLVSASTIVPLHQLASGAAATPFRIAGAARLEDVAWTSDGVMMLVVGTQLGVIGDAGFTAIVALPEPHMRVAGAAADDVWLFGQTGTLYRFAKGGVLATVLHGPAAIADVSGTPSLVYLAIGGSIVRRTASATDLVFDGADPITALATIPDGVAFSTKHGVFILARDRTVARLADASASAIAVHGDDMFLQLDGVGVVHGSVAALVVAALAAPHPDPQPAVTAVLPEPQLTTPPARAAFVPPAGPNDFKDVRFAIGGGLGGSFSSGSTTGPLTDAFAVHLARVWSSDLPGLVWTIGLDLDRARTDIAHPGSTLDNMALRLGLAYGFMIGDSLQVELGPVVEGDGAALDEPFSSSTAWGNAWGIGGALAVHYVWISGLELGAVAGYSVRWFSLSGDCTPCAMPNFSADVTTTSASLAMSIGHRY